MISRALWVINRRCFFARPTVGVQSGDAFILDSGAVTISKINVTKHCAQATTKIFVV